MQSNKTTTSCLLVRNRIILINEFKIEISNVEGTPEIINYGVLLVLFGGGERKSATANKDRAIQQETWLVPQKS